jgi:hypothetical protein
MFPTFLSLPSLCVHFNSQNPTIPWSPYTYHMRYTICSTKVSAPMIECSPWTAQPPHKINYENSWRNFGYVGHPLVRHRIWIRIMCGEGLTKLLRFTCVRLDSICDSFHKSKYFLFLFFCRRISTSQLTILQILKQFKLVILYLQGFED